MHQVVCKHDPAYPAGLLKVNKPPENLYIRGEFDPAMFDKSVAVVGSRRMSSYGKVVCTSLVRGFARAGLNIVSGFMYGVDATAHTAALDTGGITTAVMPCGIDLIHPPNQKDLYHRILENGGLIISEYEDDFLPQVWTYPLRNRIVVGLVKAVVIVEAGLGSGSLITADLAKIYKKPIFCVPGPVTSATSFGTNRLIREGFATLLSDSSQVLDLFDLNVYEGLSFNSDGVDEASSQILEILSYEPMSLMEVCAISPFDTSLTISKINNLLLNDFLVDQKGMLYVNKSK